VGDRPEEWNSQPAVKAFVDSECCQNGQLNYPKAQFTQGRVKDGTQHYVFQEYTWYECSRISIQVPVTHPLGIAGDHAQQFPAHHLLIGKGRSIVHYGRVGRCAPALFESGYLAGADPPQLRRFKLATARE
jgi:hypothetical protein